jgi:hypothetical protein
MEGTGWRLLLRDYTWKWIKPETTQLLHRSRETARQETRFSEGCIPPGFAQDAMLVFGPYSLR